MALLPADDNVLGSVQPPPDAATAPQAGNRREFLSSCLIVDLIDGTYLTFQTMPDEIAESKSANWEDTVVMGRSVPLKGYAGSGARRVQLQLQYVDDLGTKETASRFMVRDVSRWLMSFSYPDYQNGLIAPPHPVLLKLGEMIQMKAVVMDVQITYSSRAGWDLAAKHSKLIEASVSFEEIMDNPPDYYDHRLSLGIALENVNSARTVDVGQSGTVTTAQANAAYQARAAAGGPAQNRGPTTAPPGQLVYASPAPRLGPRGFNL